MFDRRSRAGRALDTAIQDETAALEEVEASFQATVRPLIWRATLRVTGLAWLVIWAAQRLFSTRPGDASSAMASVGALIAGGVAWFLVRQAMQLPND